MSVVQVKVRIGPQIAAPLSVTSASISSALGAQSANTFYGGPSSGAAAAPSFRALVSTDWNVNAATAITDAATMDLTAIKHTLTTSSATRTFTISYTGDDITLIVTLNATSSTFTFPATSLCVSEGTASGDNTLALSGVSGDKYVIAIKKVGSAYYVVSKNFGQ